jgi:SAM-dependent methyltransferase
MTDLVPWALDLLTWRGGELVLDVGCGNGRYLVELAERIVPVVAIGGDLSSGMLESTRRRWPPDRVEPALVVLDGQHLPVREDSVDVVLATHLLYHVPDVELTVAEMRRVVRPGGAVLVTTKGAGHLARLEQVVSEELSAHDVHAAEPFAWAGRFTLDTGRRMLRRWFGDVSIHLLHRELVVQTADPVVAYVRAVHGLVVGATGTTCDRDRFADGVRSRIGGVISRTGSFRDWVDVAAFVCRP